MSDKPRWLFVCSYGLMRSPTAADMFRELGVAETRYAGSCKEAERPLTQEDLDWATDVFFMMPTNYWKARHNFGADKGWYTLFIPDEYERNSPKLKERLREALQVRGYLK